MSTIRRLHQFVLAIAIAVAVSIQFSGSAQTLSGSIGAEHQEALRALGQVLASAPDRLDPLLAQLGFPVTTAPEGFTDWPTVRKLEAAYLSASAGGTPEDGERFLRTLSRTVAADVSNAIRYEKPLAPFFPEPTSGPLGPRPKVAIQWGEIPRAAPANLAPEARNAIAAMSRYVDRVPGGMQSIMAACCGITPSEAYEILRTTGNRSDALAEAIARGRVPPTPIERLARAARVVHDNTNALRADARLNDALVRLNGGEHGVPTDGPGAGGLGVRSPAEVNAALEARLRAAAKESQSPPDLSGLVPPGSSGGGGGGGGGGTPDANLRRFRSAQAEVSRSVGRAAGPAAAPAARTSFRAMRGVARGFGGVVFGAKVTASTGLAKPIQMSWVNDTTIDGVSWGHFDLVTDGREVWMTKRMRAADAYAAVEIVRGRRDVFHALDVAGEEGVGVAGVAGGQLGELRRFLVHPALYGLAVGEAAILADATGFMMSSAQLERHLAAAGVSAERRADAARWHTARNGFYKITDVPLLVVLRDGVVRVERTPDADSAESLRQIAFLTFQAYDEDGAELPESSRPFYKVVPGLTTALPHFDHLNQFAETFALVRWAAIAKARITPPPTPRRSNVRTAVKRSTTGAIGVISEKQFLSELPVAAGREVTATETRAAAILKKGNASAHATQESAEIFAKIKEFVERSITRDIAQTMSASTTPSVVHFASKRADEAKAALPSNEPLRLIAQMVSPEQALQFGALIVRRANGPRDTSGLGFLKPLLSPEEDLKRFIARELPWFFEWYAEVVPLLTAPPWGE